MAMSSDKSLFGLGKWQQGPIKLFIGRYDGLPDELGPYPVEVSVYLAYPVYGMPR
jgi:hypothetical protein